MSKIASGTARSMVAAVMRRVAFAVAAIVVACSPATTAARPSASLPPSEHQMHQLGDPVRVPTLLAGCDAAPVGALEPARAAWCEGPRASGASTGYEQVLRGKATATAVIGRNSWVDAFGSAVEHAAMPSGYRAFEAGPPSFYRSVHFVHNGHWMVDVLSAGVPPEKYVGGRPDPHEPSDFGGALMRPDRAFRVADGRVVVEADTSAGMEAYVDAWPEIVVTTAPEPTSVIDPRFTYGIFGGHATVGCRFEKDRIPVCAAFGPDGPLFELAHDRTPGGTILGGAPTGPRVATWRVCGVRDPDARCRDRFRLELEPGRLVLSVNGTRYMEHELAATVRLPMELFTADVYVYFGSWLYQPTPAVVRFHWGRIAVNPGA